MLLLLSSLLLLLSLITITIIITVAIIIAMMFTMNLGKSALVPAQLWRSFQVPGQVEKTARRSNQLGLECRGVIQTGRILRMLHTSHFEKGDGSLGLPHHPKIYKPIVK